MAPHILCSIVVRYGDSPNGTADGVDEYSKNRAVPSWKMAVGIDTGTTLSPSDDNDAAFLHR